MSEQDQREELIARLEDAVDAGLDYFLREGRTSDVKVGDWGVWEVLCHMVYWHRATVDGVESIMAGGGPYLIDGETDEVNQRFIASMAGQGADELVDTVRGLQTRLVAAIRRMDDPAQTVFVRHNGASASALDRLQVMTRHWSSHVDELNSSR